MGEIEGTDKKKVLKKYFVYVILLIINIYIFYAIFLLMKTPTDTLIVENSTITLEESATGYIIRNEQVVKGENYKNGILPIVSEGTRAAKGQNIFRYYASNEKEIENKISEIDLKIQEALENENTFFSSDINQIEKEIDEKIQILRNLRDLKQILEFKKEISNLVIKKAKIAGELSTSGSYIKELANQRGNYEKQLIEDSEYVIAPISGMVSYRVDNLEDILKADDLSNLTEDKLEGLGLKTGKIISASNECAKIVDNFNCYIATILNSEASNNAEVGDDVVLRFSNNNEVDAEIVKADKQVSGKMLIVLKFNEIPQELTEYRKISFDVIWWKDSGLKVPNQTVVEKDGLKYVVKTRSGYLSKLLVKVLRKNDKYSIITTYTTEELVNLGIDISKYTKIKLYDEILLYPDLNKVE